MVPPFIDEFVGRLRRYSPRAAGIAVVAALLVGAGREAPVAAQPQLAPSAGDPAAGMQTFFTWCAACHYFDSGAPSIVAPNLFGVVGRRAGQIDDFFGYSDQLRNSGIIWTEMALNAWLEHPAAMVPGTLMEFPGLGAAADRADVIAFLKRNR